MYRIHLTEKDLPLDQVLLGVSKINRESFSNEKLVFKKGDDRTFCIFTPTMKNLFRNNFQVEINI
jgi:hypothetical protein